MRLKINKEILLYFFLLFFFIEPAFLQRNTYIHTIYTFGQMFSTLLLIFIYVLKKIKPSKIIILLWLVLIGMIFSTFHGLGDIRSTLAAYLCYVGLSMWFDIYVRKNPKGCFDMIVLLLDIYVLINFASFVLFPNGLYISQSYQNEPYVCWFFGYKNPQIRILLPYVALLFARDSIFRKKIKYTTYIKLFLIALITLKLKSSTGIVSVFTFIMLNLIFSNNKESKLKKFILKIMNIRNVYIFMLVLYILIVFFQFQNNFSYIIVNVLHKDLDLTDRIFVWLNVIPVIKTHLLFGQGVLNATISRGYIGASHAHNYMLNTLYNGGLVSLVLLSIIWIIAGQKSLKYVNSNGVRYLKFMAIIFLIMGITESLTVTVLLYPILILISHSDMLEGIECYGGNQLEKNNK